MKGPAEMAGMSRTNLGALVLSRDRPGLKRALRRGHKKLPEKSSLLATRACSRQGSRWQQRSQRSFGPETFSVGQTASWANQKTRHRSILICNDVTQSHYHHQTSRLGKTGFAGTESLRLRVRIVQGNALGGLCQLRQHSVHHLPGWMKH